jgi:hypothetical protein
VGRGGEGHSHVAWLLLPLLQRSDRVVAAPASFRYFGRSPALSAVSAGCLSRRSGYASPLLGRIREGWMSVAGWTWSRWATPDGVFGPLGASLSPHVLSSYLLTTDSASAAGMRRQPLCGAVCEER